MAVDYAVVGGGGGGGQLINYYAAGGGGGGVLQGSALWQPDQYTVTVGIGGKFSNIPSQLPGNGGDSSIIGPTVSLTAIGGGAAGIDGYAPPGNGGSGGGQGSASGSPGAGIPGQGSAGGAWSNLYVFTASGEGGGGGGAGGPGGSAFFNGTIYRAGAGGLGVNVPWLGGGGFGGGGGAGGGDALNAGAGSNGGGSGVTNGVGGSGTPNTGGGGGGGGWNGSTVFVSGSGGSGLVAFRVATLDAHRILVTSGSYTAQVSSAFTIFRFTTDGAFSVF